MSVYLGCIYTHIVVVFVHVTVMFCILASSHDASERRQGREDVQGGMLCAIQTSFINVIPCAYLFVREFKSMKIRRSRTMHSASEDSQSKTMRAAWP